MTKAEREERERERAAAMIACERDLARGEAFCGIDEAGRGPLAGPVVAAAVILSPDFCDSRINDSKQVPEKRREELYDVILKNAVSVGVGIMPAEKIDEINILQADYAAMRIAFAKLSPRPALTINDAVTIPDLPACQIALVKADAKCFSVAAASIIAKVTRDRMMREYDQMYPEYGFVKNKGYGTADHIAAIRKYGLCPIHRRSFTGHFTEQETPAG